MSDDELREVLQRLIAAGALVETCLHHDGVPVSYDVIYDALDRDGEYEFEDLCVPAYFVSAEALARWNGIELADQATPAA